MKRRIITAFVLAAILVPLLIIGKTPLLIATLLISFGGAYEMMTLYFKGKRNIICKISVSFMTSLFTLVLFWTNQGNMSQNEFLGFILIMISFIVVAFVLNESISTKGLSFLIFTILYVGLGSASIVVLRYIGLSILMVLVLTTVFTDSFAYFIGISIGKHKIAPKISPKKSYEGSIGGTMIATILVPIYVYFFSTILDDYSNITLWEVILFVFILSIMIQFGDLVASKVKREHNIKDFSNLFPGHGGVMDRFDSMLLGGMFMLGILLYFII